MQCVIDWRIKLFKFKYLPIRIFEFERFSPSFYPTKNYSAKAVCSIAGWKAWVVYPKIFSAICFPVKPS